jgi:hypothetical protein
MDAEKKRRKIERKPWNDAEKMAVQESFGRFFYTKDLPGKNDINLRIASHACLSGRSWRNVKDYIRNHQLKSSTALSHK